MSNKIILASKSKIRAEILKNYGFNFDIAPSNIDEEEVKESMLNQNASPLSISKNLAELKANKISQQYPEKIVLGVDSVIDLSGKLINKPKSREEALKILIDLNGKEHHLISSICISRGGLMIWHYSGKSLLKMKNLQQIELENYLSKIDDVTLKNYGVYQIEAGGEFLFERIEGDRENIMGLPIKQIKEYLGTLK
tara:strand:+ start:646 stop:1233 length:588 start_codon:yes stop_codon:yes gene_type:complete